MAQAIPFHMITYQTAQALVVRKKADGVVLTVIDTPGLIESDAVSETVRDLICDLVDGLIVVIEAYCISVQELPDGRGVVCGSSGYASAG